jgi:hypothetical protein
MILGVGECAPLSLKSMFITVTIVPVIKKKFESNPPTLPPTLMWPTELGSRWVLFNTLCALLRSPSLFKNIFLKTHKKNLGNIISIPVLQYCTVLYIKKFSTAFVFFPFSHFKILVYSNGF